MQTPTEVLPRKLIRPKMIDRRSGEMPTTQKAKKSQEKLFYICFSTLVMEHSKI